MASSTDSYARVWNARLDGIPDQPREQLYARVLRGSALEHAREPYERRVPDELRNVDRDSRHGGHDNSAARAALICP